MQISVAILVGVNRIKSYIERIIKAFKTRVLSYSNSIFEAEACLVATLRSLNAIGLLDNASLVITPNAYTEGILYDVVPNTTLGDMNVVRATTATRVNSAGLIEEVPRNLLTYSEQFENTSWLTGGAGAFTITTNSTNAPNGTLTADKLIAPLTNQVIRQNKASINTSCTLSVYLKTNSGTKQMRLFINDTEIQSIVNVTSDWQRFTLSGTTGGTLLGSGRVGISNVDILNESSFVYIWGAQFENFATATEYFPTTTRLNIPRIDYTNGSCPSLLVEPQRTNLALNSDGNLSTYGTVVNVTNASSSFNSFVNAIQFPSTGTSAAYKTVVTTVQTYAISAFIKMDDNSVPILSASASTGNVCLLIAGAVVTSNLKVESYGNNVYRLSGTGASAGINGNNGVLRFDTQVLKSFKITGIQLEAASYPTSYIPTVASSVTRNADVISKTGISSLIGQTEGTLFSDFNVTNNDLSSDKTIFSVDDNSYYVNIIAARILSNNFLNITFRANSVSVTLTNLPTITNGNHKIAIRYGNGFASIFVDGILRDTKIWTNSFTNSLSQLFIGKNRIEAPYFNDRIKSVQVYKTALSDTECIALTTL